VVGRPEDSYSQSNKKWLKTRAKVKFIVFYNIYKASLTGKSAQAVKEMAKKQAVEIASNNNIFDIKIIRHYNFHVEIFYLMSLYAKKAYRRYLKKLKKRVKHRIKAILS
jgi:hypothetical protein